MKQRVHAAVDVVRHRRRRTRWATSAASLNVGLELGTQASPTGIGEPLNIRLASIPASATWSEHDERRGDAATSERRRRWRRRRRRAPAAGRGSASEPSVKPRHENIATQVVPAAAAARWPARLAGRRAAGSCRVTSCRLRRRRGRCGRPVRCCGRAPARRRRAGRAGRARPRASPGGSAAAATRRRRSGAPTHGVDVEGERERPSRRGAASGAAPARRRGRRRRPRRQSARRAARSASQPVSSPGLRSAGTTASASSSGAGVELGVPGVPGAARVLAGGGDQPDREAAVAQVHRDRGGGGHRGLERRRDALAAVGARAGCRGRASPATARAAPRGAPSARRPGPSCASARGAGRRRGGTRGP